MLPSRDQIEHEAYYRWIRRDRAHGYDRHDWLSAENELTFLLNYKTVVEYPLRPKLPLIVGADKPRRCRFCERIGRSHSVLRAASQSCKSPVRRHFSPPTFAMNARPTAVTRWRSTPTGCGIRSRPDVDILQDFPRRLNLVAAFKSLIASALLVMPLSDLEYFSDTLEWVSNPDFEYDGSLLTGTFCRVYSRPIRTEAWLDQPVAAD